MNWSNGFETICRTDVPLRQYTWYQLGGSAKWLCEPRSEAELCALLVRIREAGLPWRVLGRGANLIVRDGGFDGVVIRLSDPVFSRMRVDGEALDAGAGADFQKLIRDSFDHDRVGLELLAGIPGTLGGVIRMNAGGRYGQIADFVRRVRIVRSEGALETRFAREVGFGYRRTELDGCVVIGAELKLASGDGAAARERYREIWNEKFQTQPPVAKRSAGCVFKNPPGDSAGRLLDEVGMKSARVGGAVVSDRHANFIVAQRSACASDVLRLIDIARDRVWSATGVRLELEVEVW